MIKPQDHPRRRDADARVLAMLMTLPAFRHWTAPELPVPIRDWVDHQASRQQILTLGAVVLGRIVQMRSDDDSSGSPPGEVSPML